MPLPALKQRNEVGATFLHVEEDGVQKRAIQIDGKSVTVPDTRYVKANYKNGQTGIYNSENKPN